MQLLDEQERRESIEKLIHDVIVQLNNFYPNKRISNSTEKKFVNKMDEIFDLFNKLKVGRENGEVISKEEIRKYIYEIFNIDIDERGIKNLIDSMNLVNVLKDISSEIAEECVVFFNTLVEVAYATEKSEELQKFIFNIDIPEIKSYFQFLCTQAQNYYEYLYKKPFRFTSESVTQLVEVYATQSGYYETFVKLMICSYDIVYRNKNIQPNTFNKLKKVSFGNVLLLTENIPDFDIFLKPYDRRLRNKIIHKDYTINYNNKSIDYGSYSISFREFLNINRDLFDVLTSFAYVNIFLQRKKLQENYYQIISDE